MTKPIRPEEVAQQKLAQIPEGVIEAFNQAIADHYADGVSVVPQSEVAELIVGLGIVASISKVYENHLLDVEPIYRAYGWNVTYEKPGFNEHGEAVFRFEQPRGRRDNGPCFR